MKTEFSVYDWDKLTLNQKRQLMKAARRRVEQTPLLDWTSNYLSDRLTADFSKLHHTIAGTVDQMGPGDKTNVIGPRESAKSTLGSLAYPLKRALNGLEDYIFLIGDTQSTAIGILDRIKYEIENNEKLQADYPDACGPMPKSDWNKQSIQLKNGTWFEAAGTGQKIRGKLKKTRPTLIIIDDPQNHEHRYSALKRSKSWAWLTETVFPLGSNETMFLSLGTSLHRDGIVDKLDGLPGWKTHRIPALIQWPVNMTLWQEWQDILKDPLRNAEENEELAREFYEQNKKEMEEGAVVNWPERKNLYTLMMMLASMGRAAFEAEEQAKPTNPDLCLFEESWTDERNILVREFPAHGEIVISVDPSLGRSDKVGDYSAIIVSSFWQGVFYIWADIKRRNVDILIDDIIAYSQENGPRIVGIEENGFQAVLQDVLIQRSESGDNIPVFPVGIKNVANKEQRIKRLTPLLSRGRIKIVANNCGSELLREQLADFPIGSHDDGPDALEMAIALHGHKQNTFYESHAGSL